MGFATLILHHRNQEQVMKEKKLATQWQPGQSGNPKGRPPGIRNKATLMAMAVLEGDAERIAQQVVSAALAGDMTAARLVLERLVPPAREKPISLTFPDTSTASGVGEAANQVVQAVAAGELLPGEGATLSAIIEQRRKAIETLELEQRIAALEAR